MPTDPVGTYMRVITRVGINDEDRALLLTLLKASGKCDCGEPAVVRYWGEGHATTVDANTGMQTDTRSEWKFRWVRCGSCPGVRKTQNVWVAAVPMEEEHRGVLKLLGDEAAFVSALRLGYRPDCLDDQGKGVVPYGTNGPWECHFDMGIWDAV